MSSRMLLQYAIPECRPRMLLQVDLLFTKECSPRCSSALFHRPKLHRLLPALFSSSSSLQETSRALNILPPFPDDRVRLKVRCSHSKSHFNLNASASRAEQVLRVRRPVASAQECSAVPCSLSGFLIEWTGSVTVLSCSCTGPLSVLALPVLSLLGSKAGSRRGTAPSHFETDFALRRCQTGPPCPCLGSAPSCSAAGFALQQSEPSPPLLRCASGPPLLRPTRRASGCQ